MIRKIRYYLKDNTPLCNKDGIRQYEAAYDGESDAVGLLEHFLKEMSKQKICVNDRSAPITTASEKGRLYAYYQNTFCTANVVGVIRHPAFAFDGEIYDITVEIRSRFDEKDKPWFLAAMLCSMYSLDPTEMPAPHQEEAFFDFLLIFLLREQLLKALQKGWYRTYVRRESNDSRMIGSLHVSEHIRRNGGLNNGRIACRYRERTEENTLNRLILCAWEYLRTRFPDHIHSLENSDSELAQAISRLRMLFPGQMPRPCDCIAENLRPIAHPFFVEYEDLRCTCLMVLRDESISFLSGNADEVQSILYYLPSLWEDYLEKHMRNILPAGYAIKSQKSYKYMYPLPSGTKQERFPKKAIPDYVIALNKKDLIVVDAKFKTDVKDNDYDKLLRDMLVTGTQTGVFLYPASGKGIAHEYDVCGNGMTVRTIPVTIPAVQTDTILSEWTKELSDTVETHLKVLFPPAEV